MTPSRRLLACLVLPLFLNVPVRAAAVNPALYSGLQWRLIGPFRAGRVVAATGVPGQPNRFYFGSVNGGVWETDNAGRTWAPISDGTALGSVGAIAVAPSEPNVIYVGSGEADIRSSLSSGDGMYKSTDAGKTWEHIGLEATRHIGDVLVDPKDANIVYVAALGHAYAANAERGVFKSTDGGRTWQNVLYKDANTGAVDLAFGADDQTIYAALWQTRRPPWSVYPPSNGPGSGLYVSHDAGAHWSQITGHGFPSEGVGRIGVARAPSNPQIVYVNVDAQRGDGGLYRSDDGGVNWAHVNGDPRIWGRWWYFGRVAVDPKNPDIVYIPNVTTYKSVDGGKSFVPFKGSPGGDDYQIAWVDPQNSEHMILGGDQGTIITLDGGKVWSSWYNQPTGQFYHVTTDNQFPYSVYASQQDSFSVKLPAWTDYDGYDEGISFLNFRPIPSGGESNYIAPDPLNHHYIYGSAGVTPYRADMARFDTVTKQLADVSPALQYSGIPYRSTWTLPVVFSPTNPHVMYCSHQMLFRTDSGGQSWTVISPDQTRKDPGVPANLDPTTARDTAVEGPRRGVIYTIAPSPMARGEIWTGTDDGLVWVTRDEGKHWENVTPTDLTAWSKVGIIEASHFDTGTAYAAVDRHRLDDDHPYIYVTHDFGKSWKLIVHGIADGDFVNVVREDPVKRGLLYAGTEHHLYVSFDDGADWQSLQMDLPVTSMRDIDVHGDDLVLATFGRGLWVMDDIAALRQIDTAVQRSPVTLFKPALAYKVRPSYFLSTPLPKDEPQAHNPPKEAMIDYNLESDATAPVILEILDPQGKLVRRYPSEEKPAQPDLQMLHMTSDWMLLPQNLSGRPGMHRFVWDLRYGLPPELVERNITEAVLSGISYKAGIWAPPGSYTVKLTVDGHRYSQPLEVKEDPRVKVTQVALQRQFEWARRIEAQRVELATASREAAALLTQLGKARAEAPSSLDGTLATFTHEADRIAGVTQAPIPDNSVRSSAMDFTSLRYLSGELANLEASVDGADAAHTVGQVREHARLTGVFNHTVAEWRNLRRLKLLILNKKLRSAGLHQIVL